MLATASGPLHCQGLPLPSSEVKENWKEHPNARLQDQDLEEAHFEAQLKNRENDVVRAWCDYVQWAADHNEDEPSVLQRACYALAGDERHRDDIRHLRLWIRHAAHIGEAEKVFDFLASEGIGVRHALLYEAWASHLERQRQFDAAERQYQLGLHLEAEPVERLRSRHEEFQRRMCKRAARRHEGAGVSRAAKKAEQISEVKAVSAPVAPSAPMGFTVHEDTALQVENEVELPVHDQVFIPLEGQRLALDELELPGTQTLLPKATSFVDEPRGPPGPKVLRSIPTEWRVPTATGRRRSSQASEKSEATRTSLPSGNVTSEFTGGLRAMLGDWSVGTTRPEANGFEDPTYTAELAQRDVLALFGTDAFRAKAGRGTPSPRTSSGVFEIFEETDLAVGR